MDDNKMPEGFAPIEEQEEYAPLYSDGALALSFVAKHGDQLRYVAQWNKWFIFDGKRWCEDTKRAVLSMAHKLCREEAQTLANTAKEKDKGLARDIASAKRRAAVISLAAENPKIAASIDQWDADLMLLNTQDGVVDLATGELKPHDPEYYMTKITACGIAERDKVRCPLWNKFIARVIPDKATQEYMYRLFGYSLSGETRDHVMGFGYGPGRNGKSTLYNTVSAIMGDYHETAATDLFIETKGERHPTDLAKLRGARMVTAIETEANRAWNETKLKSITGGDPITARFMRQDPFTFRPQFTLHVVGNHKPRLKKVDTAMKARIQIIPFLVTIPAKERDHLLPKKLEKEWPSILRLMVDGCVAWDNGGLNPPQEVTDASENYFEGEDMVSLWIAECCEVEDKDAFTLSSALFTSWKGWAEQRNIPVGALRAFTDDLESRGFEGARSTDKMRLGGRKGIKIRPHARDGGMA